MSTEHQTKRTALNKYLSQFSQERLTSFNCTFCAAEIGTVKPEPGDASFDSSCSCPDCDQLMFKVVRDTGEVSVQAMT